MDQINKFIMNLSAIIVFMTAVEIIAPDNSMKKYIKFVLGLILIAFMINPIIYFASSGETIITQKIQKFTEEVSNESHDNVNKDEMSKKMIQDNFKKKFQDNLNDKLLEEYPDNKFESSIEGSVDFENMKFNLDKLYIYVTKADLNNDKTKNEEDSVKDVEKVIIGKEKKQDSCKTNDEFLNGVCKFVSENIQISKDKIVVKYK